MKRELYTSNPPFGRTSAEVLLPDGTNVTHTLVKDGWCWEYRKRAPGETVLEEPANETRGASAGAGVDAEPAVVDHEVSERAESDSGGAGGKIGCLL